MCSIQTEWRYDSLCIRLPSVVFPCCRWVRVWWKHHHNRVRTLIRDPLASLSDLMNTCIFNTYISQALPWPLCSIMEWLVVFEFHLKFYLIESICNWRKQLWLVTDASKAKYLPNKKRSSLSVFMSAQPNSSRLNRSCSFIFGEGEMWWQTVLCIPELKEMSALQMNCKLRCWRGSWMLWSADCPILTGARGSMCFSTVLTAAMLVASLPCLDHASC